MEKKNFKYYVNIWLPPILWATLIFSLSSVTVSPSSRIIWQDFVIKKTAHIIEYCVLAILLYRGFRLSKFEKRRAAKLSILISILYAVTDEFHQSFTPGRQPKVYDVLFDTIGAILAIFILWKLLPQAPVRLKNWAKKSDLL